jgi:hypothetical protein
LRNPQTQARHKREVLWQIILPLILGIILFLGASVLVTLGASGEVSRWAEATLVWLIVPWLVVSIVAIAALVGLVYGVVKLIQVVPFAFFRLNNFIHRVQGFVSQAEDKAVEPVLKIASLRGRLHALRSRTTWRR